MRLRINPMPLSVLSVPSKADCNALFYHYSAFRILARWVTIEFSLAILVKVDSALKG